ncbi:ClpXP adapter SpxH family protein [Thermaerobacillus caldiproteolyticus]|uniref:ClpXP adapter protein SpxH n=1 Tax=Thermaerobacillus caldiproteolyticus TaxID=247480 RepID=A0A7V9Z6J9_9BACL|nr:ClpXP adapter SpxH family protein [Anoxybacillus caldiproteolyticus]MBA2874939.1 putative DsbA family dithiol-disulfide isomerase [Anoxybacillus caldiproteolyticus]QPA31737.1 DsbA family protein [Anoxybacillus caldiproteolyticus]
MNEKTAGKANHDWFVSQLCNGNKKPLEIYLFIDPLCPECWGLEPVLKKLIIEYGRFFTLKYVLSGKLATLNIRKKQKFENIAHIWERTASRSGMSCDGSLWFENPISTPYAASIAIKAAELQGKRAGIRFLRKLQELLFLEKQNVSDVTVLIECAKSVGLDVDEFVKDLQSNSAAKAFQCDLKISSEMDVHEIPTLVFFNENIEEEGIKISGCYPYEIYVELIHEMLGFCPEPTPPPPLESFLSHFKFVATKEIAVVYNMSIHKVEKEMKKLQLKQKVEKVPVKHGTFWRYVSVKTE